MAKTWTISGGIYSGTAMELYLAEQSQSVNKNTTTLSWVLRAWNTTGSSSNWYSMQQNDIGITINGTTVFSRAYTSSVLVSVGTDTNVNNKKTIASGTTTISHNSDGSKSCAVSWYFYPHWDQATWNWSGSSTLSLTNIPRASSISLSATSVEFGNAVTINITRASTSFTHTLKYSIGSTSGTIASGVTTNRNWTIPTSFMNQIPNATSGTITITCDTYSGSTKIGTATTTLKATVPASIVPSLSIAVSEGASLPDGISGYIQGKSKLKITNTASGIYNSTIKSYKTTVLGVNYTGASVTTGVMSKSGTVSISVTVTDSRGRTKTVSTSVTIIAYSAPKLTSVSAYRCVSDSNNSADRNGSYICVKPSGSLSAIENTNEKICTVYYKKSTESAYASATIEMSDYILDTEYLIFEAEENESYDIYVVLQDSFSSVTYVSKQVQSISIPIDLLKNALGNICAIALGKIAELVEYVDFGWNVIFRKNIYMNNYSDDEKNHYFHNNAYRQGKTYEADGLYPHGCKLYGGNAGSKTGIGFYDSKNSRAIWIYNDVDNTINSAATLISTSVSITASTAVSSISNQTKALPFLRLCLFSARFTVAADIAAAATTTLGTIPSAYRPTDYVALSVYINSSASTTNCAAYVAPNGSIAIHCTSVVAAGRVVTLSGAWLY